MSKAKKPTPIDIPSGSLRVWWIPPAGHRPFTHPVADLAQAKFALTMLAGYDAFLDRHVATTTSSRGLQVYKDGQWTEWRNADGNDIRWVMQSQEAA